MEFHSNVFYVIEASLVSLNKALVLSLSTVGSQFLTLSQFRVFTPPVGFFSNYMRNISMSPTLQICVIGSFVSKATCVMFTVQGLNLCRPFCSCLDLLCQPFLGISSLHHVFSGPCRKILCQFHIQLVFELPHVG